MILLSPAIHQTVIIWNVVSEKKKVAKCIPISTNYNALF